MKVDPALRSAVRTGWVRPAERRKGQDHLAVQAVSAHVYAELVPGLTNVTDRISYYSFYPWLLWAYEKEDKRADSAGLVEVVRRAECAVTFVAALHSLQDDDPETHVGGLTGRLTLGPAARLLIDGAKARLSEFATQEATEQRYFKNRLGGLGQYYLGPLRQVGVLAGDARSGVRYTRERGAVLAELVDAHVDRAAFFRVLRGDRVDEKTLSGIGEFCPCRLEKSTAERDALRDLVLNRRQTAFFEPSGEARRETVALLLDVASSSAEEEAAPALAVSLLDAAYAGALRGRGPWRLPAPLERARRRWAAYQRHELLSVAVQGLFWAGLAELQEHGGRIPSAESYGAWFARAFERALGGRPGRPFTEFLQRESQRLSPLNEVESKDHELRLGDRVLEAFQAGDRQGAVKAALRVLAALLAREDGNSPYADLQFPGGYFDAYEINLHTLRRHWQDGWRSLGAGDWLRWLGAKWGVLAHLRIALRKLHYESLETFKIIPHDGGLEVVEAPDVGWTNPRLAQLTRALVDLGLLDRMHGLTEAGGRVREELHASD